MSQNPLVSILIPMYNREDLIKETLESALLQTYRNIEIIVVDNCSTDNSFLVVQEYQKKDPRIKLFKNEANLGPVRNWKRCIEKANGEYIKILWSDDKIGPTFIEKTLPILEKHPKIGFVYTKTIIFSDETHFDFYRFGQTGLYHTSDFVFYALVKENYVPVSPGNALFRKKDIIKNLMVEIPNPKNLDFTRYGAGNDLLLFLGACRDYEYFYFIDSPEAMYRFHKKALSSENALDEYYTWTKVLFLESNPQRYSEYRNLYYSLIKSRKKQYSYMIQGKEFRTSYLGTLHLRMLDVRDLMIRKINALKKRIS